jgi:chitin synthase
VLVLFVVNAMWLVLMLLLATSQSTSLEVLDTNPLGFMFLAVYGSVFLIQFLTVIYHRVGAVTQALSHVPFPPKSHTTGGDTMSTNSVPM